MHMTALQTRRPFFLAGLSALVVSPAPSVVQYLAGGGEDWMPSLSLLVTAAALTACAFIPPRNERGWGRGVLPGVSPHELGAAVTILAILGIYGGLTLQILQRPPSLAVTAGALIASGIAMAVVTGIGQALIVLVRGPMARDERDRDIARASRSDAHIVLVVGVWVGLVMALIDTAPALVAYALLGLFLASELVRLMSQIVRYRLG
jgi:hypothetical protein